MSVEDGLKWAKSFLVTIKRTLNLNHLMRNLLNLVIYLHFLLVY